MVSIVNTRPFKASRVCFHWGVTSAMEIDGNPRMEKLFAYFEQVLGSIPFHSTDVL